MKKILFFLATEKGYRVLDSLLNNKFKNYVAGVVSFHEIGMQRDYFSDIRQMCSDYNIQFYEWKEIKDDLIRVIREESYTNCVAISWRYLLPLSVNRYLKDPIIIFHDSLLPRYRGFSPLVTAMLNEDNQIGASVLFATEKADCGEIILQKAFDMNEEMYIQDAIKKMAELYANLAIELVSLIVDGRLTSTPQDEDNASYSIWRDDDDYWINWSWSADKINRLIHAIGYPYKGAKTKANDTLIRVVRSCVEPVDLDFTFRHYGKVWSLNDGMPVVVCGSGMLRIEEAVDEQGNIYQFTRIRTRFGGGTDLFTSE